METLERSDLSAVPPLAETRPIADTPLRSKSKYRRISELVIRPLVLSKEKPAFDIAREFYAQFSDLDFGDDLLDYMRTGFVVVRPHLFAMVKPIRLDSGEDAWFIRMIVGDLGEAISCMPCELPKVAFCRNNDPGHLVICDTQRAIQVAMATRRKAA